MPDPIKCQKGFPRGLIAKHCFRKTKTRHSSTFKSLASLCNERVLTTQTKATYASTPILQLLKHGHFCSRICYQPDRPGLGAAAQPPLPPLHGSKLKPADAQVLAGVTGLNAHKDIWKHKTILEGFLIQRITKLC